MNTITPEAPQSTLRSGQSPFTTLERSFTRLEPTPYLQGSGMTTRVLALFLLVMMLPVLAVLLALVRVASRGPGLYKQVRVGRDGRIFVMYKIRSMVEDSEAETGPVWTQDINDPRITRVGKFLRKSHLDELPQLVNVVRGEMALFGPRPERPELVQILADSVPGYLDRLAVKPGITGLAQINLPPDSDLESVRRKLDLDLEYIETASFGMELRMFIWTGLRLIGFPASLATSWMRLGRKIYLTESAGPNRPVTISEIRRAR